MTTLGDLASSGVLTFNDGYRTKRQEHAQSGYRILRAGDVREGAIHPSGPDFVSSVFARQVGDKVARTGDVVLTTKGTVGRVAQVHRLDEPVVYSPQVCFFRTLDATVMVQPFLRYWLQSDEFTAQAVYLMGATDMAPYISLRDLRGMSITLPEVVEQQAIADVLGALDDKIAANARLAASADRLAEQVYRGATELSPQVPSSRVLSPVLGATPDRTRDQYWRPEVPWASARDVTGAPQGVILSTAEAISAEAAMQTRARTMPKGSVVLTARVTVGAVARLGIESAFNQSCYAFVPGAVPPACLYFVVRDVAARGLSVAHGSVFSTITTRSFDAILVPDIGSDDIEVLEAKLSPLLDLVEARVIESRSLGQLRDTLLPHLMSGRISVRDAEAVVSDAV